LHFPGNAFTLIYAVEQKHVPVDFRHLESFCRVADLRSFSKAADDLFLTQPTVSGHILSLEQSLGLRLLDRTGREARLTKGGQIFYHYASKILAFRREALNALSEFSEGIRGDLTLGASTIPGEYLLPKLLGDFKKEHPRLNISLKIADSKEVAQYILQDRVELGVTGARLNHPSLHYQLLEQDEIIIVGPPSPRGQHKQRVRFEDMLNEPWVVREEGSGTQMAVEKALKKKNRSLKQLNQTIEMGSTSSVKEAVKAGLGFAFISRKAVEQELEQGQLSSIQVEGMEPISRQIYIVLRQGKTFSPMGMKFLQYLKKRRNERCSPL
jgi:DNA-binding transcriptional LysR family regulator